jgi:hypothetical protein
MTDEEQVLLEAVARAVSTILTEQYSMRPMMEKSLFEAEVKGWMRANIHPDVEFGEFEYSWGEFGMVVNASCRLPVMPSEVIVDIVKRFEPSVDGATDS